jgi:hypothetical protein
MIRNISELPHEPRSVSYSPPLSDICIEAPRPEASVFVKSFSTYFSTYRLLLSRSRNNYVGTRGL